MYQILTDRFDNGDPSNDTLSTLYAPATGDRTHGGDYKGVIRRIPYLKSLGVTALWISPIVLNVNGAYHGYHAQNFLTVAPHFGTEAELQEMIRMLQSNGIRVIIDVVPNHGGDLINNNSYLAPPSQYTLSYRSGTQHAAPFTALSNWHAHGTIGNFTDPEQILGELVGLDDLKTENADIRTTLSQIFSDWITRTNADGYRVDTVKHVEMGFWQTWTPAVRAHAQSLGKNNFFIFGEVFDGNSAYAGSFTGTKAGGAFALDSILDYTMYYRTNDVFARATNGGQAIMDYYGWQSFDYDPAAIGRLVTFLDNHDNNRFLNSSLANNNLGRARAAIGFQLTSPGVPCIYYGFEQDFSGGADPANREDFFDGQYESGAANGNNFNMLGTTYRHTRRLNELRRRIPTLRRGDIVSRQASYSAGVFAYSRTLASNPQVLVAINTSDTSRTASAWTTGLPAGTVLVDHMNPGFNVVVNGSGQVPSGTSMPPNITRVFVPATSALDMSPEVTSASVAHDTAPASVYTPLVLTFSEAISTPTATGALITTPTLSPPPTLSWNTAGTQLTITPPPLGWSNSEAMRFQLTDAITDLAGNKLFGGFMLDWKLAPLPVDPGVDGTMIGDPTYPEFPASVQTVQTGFGNNTNAQPHQNSGGSELDNLFIAETSSTLYLGIAGNLEINGNVIAVLVDLDSSAAAGTTNLNATGATNAWVIGAQGTTMPSAFRPDIALVVSASGSGQQNLNATLLRWNAAGALSTDLNLGSISGVASQPTQGILSATVDSTPTTFALALDNSHTGPVASGSGTASPDGSTAITGLELGLPRSLFAGTNNRRILVGLSGSTAFWSNQFLPPLTPRSNLGNDPNFGTIGITGLSLPAVPVTISNFSAD